MGNGERGRGRENCSYSGSTLTADITGFANGWHVRYERELSSMIPRFWPDWKKE